MIYARVVELSLDVYYKYSNRNCSRLVVPDVVAKNFGLLVGDLVMFVYNKDLPAMFFNVYDKTKTGNYRLYRVYHFAIQTSLFPQTQQIGA